MINYWWVTRPKRKLNSVPDVLATFAEQSLDEEWQGQRGNHLSFEDALEEAGLKRVGERRDHTGGGARTYKAWLMSLGLMFIQESTGKLKLTLAGEAIMEGQSPVKILKDQIFKYQFPSSYSLSKGVQVSSRFRIRPFRFLLRLLADPKIDYLTESEIAKIIAVEAETEKEKCYHYIVDRVLDYRQKGDSCLEADFFQKYGSSKVKNNTSFDYLLAIANTMLNWLEYTQLVYREKGTVRILDDKMGEVKEILRDNPKFIDRPEEHEYFQRKFGVDPNHKKDTRNLTETKTITPKIIAEQKVKQAYISESLKSPITKISVQLIDKITEETGINDKFVEETLLKLYPKGSVGSFMTEYFEMAFKGRDEATKFEKATVQLFEEVFGFETYHVGPIGLTPDVLIVSDGEGYQAIIDNKAYSKYSISNDHHNRMVHNYIGNLQNYSQIKTPLAFFSYIAGGFGKNINTQIQDVVSETGVPGSAMSVTNMIKLVETYEPSGYDHKYIRNIFSLNRQVLLGDI